MLGPPPTSGTRDAFVELAMEAGGTQFDWIKALEKKDKKKYQAICQTLREDGAYIEAGENDNLIVQKLEANPDALGIFGFSFLDQNTDRIQGTRGGWCRADIRSYRRQQLSRLPSPFLLCQKSPCRPAFPGMREYLEAFTSEQAWGDDGYLSDKGLIPMPDAERKDYRKIVQSLSPLSCSDL